MIVVLQISASSLGPIFPIFNRSFQQGRKTIVYSSRFVRVRKEKREVKKRQEKRRRLDSLFTAQAGPEARREYALACVARFVAVAVSD